ncbi:24904_t:CDS:2, partial [Gigaspora margarita]
MNSNAGGLYKKSFNKNKIRKRKRDNDVKEKMRDREKNGSWRESDRNSPRISRSDCDSTPTRSTTPRSSGGGLTSRKAIDIHFIKRKLKLLEYQQKMLKNLSKGKFRWINEKLYSSSSSSALELFQNNPLLFDEYHQGFRSAVNSWPVNPADILIDYLKGKPKEWIVADLGCGEGKIAQEAPNKVLSFDLVANNHMIIACDIAKLPIPNCLFDIVIFCLSLMGTNYVDFLKEAYRTLKPKGELKIAEVVSRFSDIDAFIKVLAEIGFKFVEK